MIPRIAFDSLNSFDKPIDFEIEIASDDEIRIRGRGREAIGGDGKVSQFALDFQEETLDLHFNWMTQDIRDQVFFWHENFGTKGDPFRYFPDGTDLTRFFECVLVGNTKDFKPGRTHPRLVNFNIKLKVRVKVVSAAIIADRAAFYP